MQNSEALHLGKSPITGDVLPTPNNPHGGLFDAYVFSDPDGFQIRMGSAIGVNNDFFITASASSSPDKKTIPIHTIDILFTVPAGITLERFSISIRPGTQDFFARGYLEDLRGEFVEQVWFDLCNSAEGLTLTNQSQPIVEPLQSHMKSRFFALFERGNELIQQFIQQSPIESPMLDELVEVFNVIHASNPTQPAPKG